MALGDTWVARPCTIKELASLYGVSYKVFKKHIHPFENEIGEKHGNFFTVNQVIIIIDKLGPPPSVDVIYNNIRRTR